MRIVLLLASFFLASAASADCSVPHIEPLCVLVSQPHETEQDFRNCLLEWNQYEGDALDYIGCNKPMSADLKLRYEWLRAHYDCMQMMDECVHTVLALPEPPKPVSFEID